MANPRFPNGDHEPAKAVRLIGSQNKYQREWMRLHKKDIRKTPCYGRVFFALSTKICAEKANEINYLRREALQGPGR